jgi:hypothetical protein
VHIIASLATLAAVVIKLGLHWRWIVATARRYIFPQRRSPRLRHRRTGSVGANSCA